MVAMNKWQDVTDTEVCQGAEEVDLRRRIMHAKPPYRDFRLAIELLQVGM
jgi:hypothetical protein